MENNTRGRLGQSPDFSDMVQKEPVSVLEHLLDQYAKELSFMASNRHRLSCLSNRLNILPQQINSTVGFEGREVNGNASNSKPTIVDRLQHIVSEMQCENSRINNILNDLHETVGE